MADTQLGLSQQEREATERLRKVQEQEEALKVVGQLTNYFTKEVKGEDAFQEIRQAEAVARADPTAEQKHLWLEKEFEEPNDAPPCLSTCCARTLTNFRKLNHDNSEEVVKCWHDRGLLASLLELVEMADDIRTKRATLLLQDFSQRSDLGANITLKMIDRISARFQLLLQKIADPNVRPNQEDKNLTESYIGLCIEVAARCPHGHTTIAPDGCRMSATIVRRKADFSQGLFEDAVLLLANLAYSTTEEVFKTGVLDSLMTIFEEYIRLRKDVSELSTLETVVFYCLGRKECKHMDTLMRHEAIEKYALQALVCSIKGTRFRNVYPHLLYSVDVFLRMLDSRHYSHLVYQVPRNVTTIMLATYCRKPPVRVKTDFEGMIGAVHCLHKLQRWGLFPMKPEHCDSEKERAFHVKYDMEIIPTQIREHEQPEVRYAFAGLYVRLHPREVFNELMLVRRWSDNFSKKCGTKELDNEIFRHIFSYNYPVEFLEKERSTWEHKANFLLSEKCKNAMALDRVLVQAKRPSTLSEMEALQKPQAKELRKDLRSFVERFLYSKPDIEDASRREKLPQERKALEELKIKVDQHQNMKQWAPVVQMLHTVIQSQKVDLGPKGSYCMQSLFKMSEDELHELLPQAQDMKEAAGAPHQNERDNSRPTSASARGTFTRTSAAT